MRSLYVKYCTTGKSKQTKKHGSIQCSVIKNPEMKTMCMGKQIPRDDLILQFQSKILH